MLSFFFQNKPIEEPQTEGVYEFHNVPVRARVRKLSNFTGTGEPEFYAAISSVRWDGTELFNQYGLFDFGPHEFSGIDVGEVTLSADLSEPYTSSLDINCSDGTLMNSPYSYDVAPQMGIDYGIDEDEELLEITNMDLRPSDGAKVITIGNNSYTDKDTTKWINLYDLIKYLKDVGAYRLQINIEFQLEYHDSYS